MGSASLPFSIVNLVKVIIGSGILCLPFVFSQTGLVLGATTLITCAFVVVFALHLLGLSVLQAFERGKDASFHSLSHAAFGGRQAATTLVNVCVILVAFGSGVAYIVVIGDLLPEMVEYLGFETNLWRSRGFWMTAIGWGVEFPLCLLPNLDSLKFSSMIGTVGILYILIVVSVFAYGAIPVPPPQQHVSMWPPPHSPHTSTAGMFESIGICVFTFGCSKNFPSLIVELKQPTVRRVDTLIVSAVGICAVIYMIVGICGSVAFGASVAGNSLKSFPNDPGTLGGLVSAFARVAMAVNVMGSIPFCVQPLRAIVLQMLPSGSPPDASVTLRSTVTFVLFLFMWGAALVLTNLDEILAFVGSTADIAISFALPGLFYYLSSRGQSDDSLFGVSSAEEGTVARDSGIRKVTGPLRRGAQVLAIVSVALIPFLLTMEAYKMFNEH